MSPVPKKRGSHATGKKPGGGHPREAKRAKGKSAGMQWWLALGAILVITFVVYVPCLDNDFTNWDDDLYVTNNSLLVNPDFTTIATTPTFGNFHPLTIWSLALNYKLTGLDPSSYHWLNLLLHLANTLLVFVFVRRLSKDRFWTTAATALFFGVHPMHVESVAWIAERKDVLYGFFYLLGLIFYLRYLDTKRRLWLLPVLLTFILSLASKPAAIVFPLTLLALDWYRRRKLTPGILIEKAPLFLLSAAAAALTLVAQNATGAMQVQWTFFQKILFAAYGTVMYVTKFFAPIGLSAIYPYVRHEGPTQRLDTAYYVAFLALLVAIPILVVICRKSRDVLFGLLFFFINIVLVLQFATVGQAVMADRYTYLPYVGLVFALAWWLDARREEMRVPGIVKPIVASVLILLAPISAAITWNRCDVWQNSLTLWNDTIAKYPDMIYDAYAYRGSYQRDVAHNYRAAIEDFDRAIALNPGIARGWNFKGMALAQTNQIDSAAVCFERALTIDPEFASALSNRGGVRLSRGDTSGAVEDLTKALTRDPRLWGALTNRALAYQILGQHENAIADLNRALQLKPNDPSNFIYRHALGVELLAVQRNAEAARAFDLAIASSPAGNPSLGIYHGNRSRARLALGDQAGARADADEARRRGVAIPATTP